jgi:hypothetical protein
MGTPPRADRRPASMRDGDGVLHVGPDRETLVERLIREAQERGEFDDLGPRGRLEVDENPYAGDRALAFHLLRNAGVAPPWIEADREARARLEDIEALVAHSLGASAAGLAMRHRRLDELIDAYAAAVATLNAQAPSARLHRRPADRAALHAALDRGARGDPDAS